MTLEGREQTEELIRAYKAILSRIIDKRPSGTRQRLADALGKHRSFITQMMGAAYATPVPERHLPAIFSVCHFSEDERREFLAAYHDAHPDKAGRSTGLARMRHVTIMAPDLGDETRNRRFDDAIAEIVARMGALFKADDE
jgi:hypothetical protein